MRIEQTPVLLNDDYGYSQTLRREIAKVQSFRDLPTTSENSRDGIDAFFDEVAALHGSGGALPGNQAVVTSGVTYPVTGGTVTLAIVGGVVTAAFTATP